MLPRLEAVDGDIGMLAERHGDDDRFDFGMLCQQFLVVGVEFHLESRLASELADQTPTHFVTVSIQSTHAVLRS